MPTSTEFIKASKKVIETLDQIDDFSESLALVKQFNKAFDIPTSNKPAFGDKEGYTLKFNLLQEELDEYLKACEEKDIVEISDSLVDLMYVLLGAVLYHGLTDVFFDMFSEVHASNMSKLENGKVLRRTDGKVLKGSDYFKPNLKEILDGRY
jgi:predicted HAD superfamily Cof-like phosphohydrolase